MSEEGRLKGGQKNRGKNAPSSSRFISKRNLPPSLLPFSYRPYWTRSLQNLVEEADALSAKGGKGGGAWTVIQLMWLCLRRCQSEAMYNFKYMEEWKAVLKDGGYGEDEEEEDESDDDEEEDDEDAERWLFSSLSSLPSTPSSHQHRLLRRPFFFYAGAAAYIVSKTGMEKLLDVYFTNRTESSLLKPLLRGRNLVLEAYYAELEGTYVVHPTLFTVEVEDTTIGEEGEEAMERMKIFGLNNEWQWEKTRKLWEGRMKAGGENRDVKQEL